MKDFTANKKTFIKKGKGNAISAGHHYIKNRGIRN
jgi:hypothetical protein